MIGSALTKIFGSKNERTLKEVQPIVNKINSFEPEIQKLSDAGLAAKTVEFKERFTNGESLDDLLPEAFAVTRDNIEHAPENRRPDGPDGSIRTPQLGNQRPRQCDTIRPRDRRRDLLLAKKPVEPWPCRPHTRTHKHRGLQRRIRRLQRRRRRT